MEFVNFNMVKKKKWGQPYVPHFVCEADGKWGT